MAEPADLNVDELRRRARRRLVGAVVLALGVAVVVPMLLETEEKPLGDDVSVKIPPVDSGKFVNRLSDGAAKSDAAPTAADAPKEAPAAPAPTTNAPPPRAQKYDTRVPDAAPQPPTADATPAASSASATSAPATSSTPATSASTANAEPPTVSAQATAPAASDESAKAAATTPHPAAETTNAAHVASAKPPTEGFAVQLAAVTDNREANTLAGRLKKAGYAAYTEPLKTSKGTLWRVRVGPYPSRDAANAARDKLKTEGQSGIVAAVK